MAGQAIGRSWSRWMADTVLEKFPRLDKKWSCSCMFTYFLMKAVNEGYIDASYTDTAKKAFNSIIREFIEVDEKGFLNLHGIGSFMMAAVQSEKSLYDMEHI